MTRRRRWALTGVAALALALAGMAGAAAAPAGAAAYRLALGPDAITAGGQTTIRATVSGVTSEVGSLNLVPADGYEVVAVTAPRGATASVRRNVVRVRGLAVGRRAAKQIALTVNAPCSSVTRRPWRARAKPTADYRGAALSPYRAHRRLATRTTGTCSLRFAPQPSDAKVGARISAARFDSGGPSPAVAVFDGHGRRSRSDDVRVAVTIAPGSAPGPLAGGRTRRSKDGVVTFPRLSVASLGSYRLLASGKRIPAETSAGFSAEQEVVDCEDGVDCAASATKSATFGPAGTPYAVRLDVNAPENPGVEEDGGPLVASLDSQPPVDCLGYAERSPATGVFTGPDREKVVTFTISPSLAAADPGELQACVGLPYDFLARLLTRATVPVDTNRDGVNDQYVGQLNDCFEIVLGLLVEPPCVADRGVDYAANPYITIRLPADRQDPRYRS